MPVAWFICPYKRRIGAPGPTRYCAMDDFTSQIVADGGDWSETEILGDAAIVKARASVGTLTIIAGTAGFQYIPLAILTSPLSSLTAGQRAAIVAKAQELGYSLAEIQARFPGADLSTFTLGDVLRFLATRRLRPRYDVGTDTIICDGPSDPVRPVSDVDAAVA
jgi:hypothetical protein